MTTPCLIRDVQAAAPVNALLSVVGYVVHKFAHQHVSQKSGTDHRLRDHAHRHRRDARAVQFLRVTIHGSHDGTQEELARPVVLLVSDLISQGWHAPPLSAGLAASVERASQRVFGRPSALIGGGGGIPFLAMLSELYPQTQFLVTGVLGPQSNAHGPNEFLHVPTAIRLTSAIALLLHDAMAGPDVSRQSKASSKSTSGLDGAIQAYSVSNDHEIDVPNAFALCSQSSCLRI
jgi:acetylornithine deacetylase/succinyl-diaminopimelate desuccinylase-like protein